MRIENLSRSLFLALLMLALSVKAELPSVESVVNASGVDINGVPGENINIFTGAVNWQVTDTIVPGINGLDMILSRSYNSRGAHRWKFDIPEFDIDLKRGSIEVFNNSKPVIEQGDERGGILHVPGRKSIVMIDPGKNAVKYDRYPFASITEHWIGEQTDYYVGVDYTQIDFLFYSPDGITYEISQRYKLANMRTNNIDEFELYYQKAIQKDSYGNHITYTKSGGSISIVSNDGRSATVSLTSVRDAALGMEASYRPRQTYVLNSLTVEDSLGQRVWDYQTKHQRSDPFWCTFLGDKDHRKDCSDANSGTTIGADYRVISVVHPDGLSDSYAYRYLSGGKEWLHLDNITTKTGALINYNFNLKVYSSDKKRVMLESRSISGSDIPTSLWRYSYELFGFGYTARFGGVDLGVASRKTKITGPVTIVDTEFHVSSSSGNGVWGEPKWKNIYSAADISLMSPLRSFIYEYDTTSKPDLLGASIDNSSLHYRKHLYFSPLKKIIVDNKYVTEYSVLDEFWNWENKTETTSSNVRETVTTYKNQMPSASQSFLVGLIDNQTVSGNGKSWLVDNSYNAFGQVTRSIDQGVQIDFDYDSSSGDLSKSTSYNHLGSHSILYDTYFRGIPELETYPENVEITRKVNDSGTIKWEIDGEGNQTNFEYDSLNRVIKINPQGVAATNIEYLNDVHEPQYEEGELVAFRVFENAIRITQDDTGYTKEIDLDGLGRKIRSTEWGEDTESIRSFYRYDAAGRQIYKTRPYVSSEDISGIETTYDALNRPLTVVDTATEEFTEYTYKPWGLVTPEEWNQIMLECGGPNNVNCVHPKASMIVDAGLNGEIVTITDANGNETDYKKTGFGHPDNAWNVQIEQEENITTYITRDILGSPENVTQGGITRTYSYYPDTQRVHTITEPERGVVTHTYDDGGNLKTRQVGSAPLATYTYDALNRLGAITYADTTPSVSYEYDKSSNLISMTNGPVNRAYQYTSFGALDDETLTVGTLDDSESFTLDYGYNASGFLDSLTYPSGIHIHYGVDDLGRITSVGTAEQNFATDVTYHPMNTIHEMTYGNGVKTTYALNSRQMVNEITAQKGIENRLKMGYTYDSVTNVSSITDYIDSTNTVSAITYDGVNRLKTATSFKWGTAAFNYDNKGNITSKDMDSLGSLSYSYNPATNQLASVSGIESRSFNYDQFGNALSNGNHDFTFNAASRMTQVLESGTTNELINYTYDADGIKALEIKEDSALYTFYSQAGDLLYEKDFVSGVESSYIQLGNQNITKINTGCIGTDTDEDGIEDCVETKLGLDPLNSADAGQDLDGDGLTNLIEIQLGTLINNADSDGDGMPDKWEVDMGLNPLADDADLDTDGDGFTSLQEYQNGTSPNEPFNFSYVLPAILHIILN